MVVGAIADQDRGSIGIWTLVISSVGAAETVAVTEEGVDGVMAYPRELRSLWLGPDAVIAARDSPDQRPSTWRATPRAAGISAAQNSK